MPEMKGRWIGISLFYFHDTSKQGALIIHTGSLNKTSPLTPPSQPPYPSQFHLFLFGR